MSDLRKAAQNLVEILDNYSSVVPRSRAHKELKKALLNTNQEPVAYQWLGTSVIRKRIPKTAEADAWAPLYTHPHQRKPLTDQEIIEAIKNISHNEMSAFTIARAIEKVHCIGVTNG